MRRDSSAENGGLKREKSVVGRDKLSRKYAPVESEVIPTNIIPLDLVLGGGFPRGVFIELSSPSGLGKSTLMAHVARNFCAQERKVDWLDFEHALTPGLKEGIGLLKYEEEGLFTHLDPVTYGDAEEILEGMGDQKPDMVIVDSESAMLPDSAMDVSIVDTQALGLKARVSAAFLNKFKGWAKKSGTTIVFINQMRVKFEKRGRTMLAFEDSAGGNALKFYMDIRLRLRRTGDLSREEETIEGRKKIIYGAETVIWALKNRNVRSHIELTMPIVFGRGVSNNMVIKNILLGAGIVSSAGSYFKISMEGVYEGTVMGNKGLNDFIRDNKDAVEKFILENDLLYLVRGDK